MDKVDVVVVGAGLAGLTAARDLKAEGRSVCVLEARERVGGRLENATFADGSVVEVGGQWVGPTQDRVLALAEELGVGLFPSFEDGEHLAIRDGEVVRWSADTFGLEEAALIEVGRLQELLEGLSQEVDLEAPQKSARAAELDRQSVEGWLLENSSNAEALAFWRTVVAAIFAAETTQMSLLHFLFYVHSGGSIDMLLATAGGAQESRVVGGSQILAVRLAETLDGSVRTGVEVSEIRQHGDGVEVLCRDGAAVAAERVIVAVPPALAARIRYQPALPADRDQLTQQFPMGYVVKIQVRYEEPFWRRDGLSGFVVASGDPLSIVFDNSPADLRCGVLLGFFEGESGRRAGAMGEQERRALALESLARYFGPEASTPLEYLDRNWAAERYSGGCYGGRLGTGVWTALGHALRVPVGRIHWAGSETSDVWNGYMDGAVRSGERAAAEALSELGAAAPPLTEASA
ncbi:MAG TPA: flavin monoamine oxidase family protein [Solirubrobacterales bacterium]|jgi:monoamine oxidase